MIPQQTIFCCDQDYQIKEVIKNQLPIEFSSGFDLSFFQLIQISEVDKAYSFFKKIKWREFLINQKFQLAKPKVKSGLVFSGILQQEQFLIIVTPNLIRFSDLIDILQENNLSDPELNKMLASADEDNMTESIFYDEMSKINNELVDMQRDITKKNIRLEQQQAHLELINKILRHDLANIFSTIKSAIRVYENKPEKKYLAAISDKAQTGVELIGNMRELENVFRSQVDLQPINLRKIIFDLAKQWPELELKIDLPAIEIWANSSLKSLFDNLLRNAWDHGKASTIKICGEQMGKKFLLKFGDNGVGIPAEIKDKIFDANFKYGATGNTGLGLSIVKQLVLSYGATISVLDNQPRGTIFEIKFRIYQN